MVKFAPQFRQFSSEVSSTLDFWIKWANGIESVNSALSDLSLNNIWGFFKEGNNKMLDFLGIGSSQAGKTPAQASGSRLSVGKIQRPGGAPMSSMIGKTTAPASSANLAMVLLQGQGWTKEQAAGIVANLQRESQFDPHAIGDKGQAYGLAQWHPDRQAEFAKWSGHDIRQSTFGEQLKFITYELRKGKEQKAGLMLAKAKSAEEAGALLSKYYERPLNADTEASLRGMSAARLGGMSSGGITISQNTTINVNGTDANSTAKAVAGAQQRVNQDIARNVRSNVS
jgi:hypothetical protein